LTDYFGIVGRLVLPVKVIFLIGASVEAGGQPATQSTRRIMTARSLPYTIHERPLYDNSPPNNPHFFGKNYRESPVSFGSLNWESSVRHSGCSVLESDSVKPFIQREWEEGTHVGTLNACG
jgi:hypothetical protein